MFKRGIYKGGKYLFLAIIGVLGIGVAAWGIVNYFQELVSQKVLQSPVSVSTSSIPKIATATTINTIALANAIPSTASSSEKNVGASVAVKPLSFALPFSASPFDSADWDYDWGSASIAKGVLTFGAASTTTGGDLFLSGPSDWKNYSANAEVNWISGDSFGIIAHETDLADFVYCDFSKDAVSIVARIGGTDTILAETPSSHGGAGTLQNLGISVSGNRVGCLVNGTEVSGSFIPENGPTQGSVGVLSWDETLGVSKVVVETLDITPLANDAVIAPFPVATGSIAVTSTSSSLAITSSSQSASSSVIAVGTSTPPQIPYLETDFASDANWQQTWGVMSVDASGFLDIGSASDTSGGTAILENASGWLNYDASATVDWASGETFMLIAHYANSNDYLGCNFIHDPNDLSAVEIQLDEVTNGNEVTIQTGEDTSFFQEDAADSTVSISIKDGEASCTFNGHVVSNIGSGDYDVSQTPGTIGFSTWDAKLGNTKIIVQRVSVNED